MLVISIILEAAVAVIAALAARAGRPYLYGLSFTSAAYVLYDLARLLQWPGEDRCCQDCSCWRPSRPCWRCGGSIERGEGNSPTYAAQERSARP